MLFFLPFINYDHSANSILIKNQNGVNYVATVEPPLFFKQETINKPYKKQNSKFDQVLNESQSLLARKEFTYKGKFILLSIAFYPRDMVYLKKYDSCNLVQSLRAEFDGSMYNKLKTNPKNYVSGGSSKNWFHYNYVLRHGMIFDGENKDWLMSVLISGKPLRKPGYGPSLLKFVLSIVPSKESKAILEKQLSKSIEYEMNHPGSAEEQ